MFPIISATIYYRLKGLISLKDVVLFLITRDCGNNVVLFQTDHVVLSDVDSLSTCFS